MLGVVKVKEVTESDVPLSLSVFKELVVIAGNTGREDKSSFYIREMESHGKTRSWERQPNCLSV